MEITLEELQKMAGNLQDGVILSVTEALEETEEPEKENALTRVRAPAENKYRETGYGS